jgi:uracil-DNA glycosylase family protein
LSHPETEGAAPFIPAHKTLPALREAVQSCRGCDLYQLATQAVLGEGKRSSVIMFVGEQPGDTEDRQGRPFVGPAGRLFDHALEDAGIDRSAVYVTNAVKHFKFEERGKRRIHKKPSTSETMACRPWLEAEVAVVRPQILVCLGATAAQAVFGPDHRVTRDRGQIVKHPWAPQATSTIHPSAILRAQDEQREVEYQRFVDDLKKVRETAQRIVPNFPVAEELPPQNVNRNTKQAASSLQAATRGVKLR